MNALFIFKNPPYHSIQTQEIIEVMLTASAFDFEVSVLFSGAGILQLLRGQHADSLKTKQFTDLFNGLDWYNIKNIYTTEETLQLYSLKSDELLIPDIIILSFSEINTLIHAHSMIING